MRIYREFLNEAKPFRHKSRILDDHPDQIANRLTPSICHKNRHIVTSQPFCQRFRPMVSAIRGNFEAAICLREHFGGFLPDRPYGLNIREAGTPDNIAVIEYGQSDKSLYMRLRETKTPSPRNYQGTKALNFRGTTLISHAIEIIEYRGTLFEAE